MESPLGCIPLPAAPGSGRRPGEAPSAPQRQPRPEAEPPLRPARGGCGPGGSSTSSRPGGPPKQQNDRRRQPKYSNLIYIAQNVAYIFQIVYTLTGQCRRSRPQFQAGSAQRGRPAKRRAGTSSTNPQKHIHGLGRAKSRRQHQPAAGCRAHGRRPHHAQAVSGEGKGQPQHQCIRRKLAACCRQQGSSPTANRMLRPPVRPRARRSAPDTPPGCTAAPQGSGR